MDGEGRIIGWNAGAEHLFGWRESDVIGRPLSTTIIPPTHREAHDVLTSPDSAAAGRLVQSPALRRDGTELAVELSITRLHLGDSAVFAVHARDMAEDRRASEEREATFQLLFFHSPLPMWVYDVETLYFLEVNATAVARYGYTRDEFLRMRIGDIQAPVDAPLPAGAPEAIARPPAAEPRLMPGDPETGRHRLKDGRVVDVEVVSRPMAFHP